MSKSKRQRQEDDDIREVDPPADEHDLYGNQTREERQLIRQGYRTIQTDIDKNRHNLIEGDDDGLNKLLEDAAKNFRQVKRTHEAAIDSQVIAQISTMGAQRAMKMSTDFVNFDANVFIAKLKGKMAVHIDEAHGGAASDTQNDDASAADHNKDVVAGWAKLGRLALPIFRTLPAVSFVYGPLEIVQVQRKQAERQKRLKFDESQKVTPLEGIAPGASSEETTTREVKVVLEQLRVIEKPINVFQFVINPDSFSQTVENIFHLSFLIKDGHARMYIENELPFVVAVEGEESSGPTEQRKQSIFSMDVPQWRELISLLNITESIIPHREVTSDGQAYASTQYAGGGSQSQSQGQAGPAHDGEAAAPKKRRK
eukprot:Opistho-2@3234